MIYVQASDGRFYRDPKIGSNKWYIFFPDLEDKPKIAIQATNRRVVAKEIKEFALINRQKGHKDTLPFPKEWILFKKCTIYDITITNVIPVNLIVAKEVVVEEIFVKQYHCHSLAFQLHYNYEELEQIYSGKLKSPIFGDLKLRTIRERIRKQLAPATVKGLVKLKQTVLLSNS